MSIQKKNVPGCLALIGLLVAIFYSPASAQETVSDANVGQAALADRLAEMGQNALRVPTIVEASWRQSAALLAAACKLNPTEPRFPRLLAEARLQVGDIDGAIEALNAYRKIQPDSPAVQAQLVDLYLSKMETADAKLKYLKGLIDSDKVPNEVRSHAATRAATVMIERTQPDQAQAMLDRAIELNHVNVAALRMRANLSSATASPAERVGMIFELLLANPVQPTVVVDLAQELAAAGMSEESLYWYETGLTLLTQSGAAPPPDVIVGYGSELVLANERARGAELVRQWLTSTPNDVDARFLQMLIEKNSLKRENYDLARTQARNVLTNELAAVRRSSGDAAATTQPISTMEPAPVGDPAGDIERIKQAGGEDAVGLLERYVTALADLAWLELYFNENPAAADPMIAAIQGVLTDESLTVTRLQGWSFLLGNRLDEAKVKLSAVADRDALAGLGLVVIARKQQQENVVEMARSLRQANAAGLIGVFVWDALQDLSVRVEPDSAVKAEVAAFPKDWMNVIDQSDTVYLIRGEPLRVSHGFGQPMLARVAIQNISKYDLSVGPEGVLRPDLWVDAQLRGIAAQNYTGVAYDRLANPLVIPAGKTVEQVVRVDQGEFARLLNTNPTVSIQAFVSITTNPMTSVKGLVSGPAGQQFQMRRIIERKATAITQDFGKQRTFAAISAGNPAEKMSAADLLGVVIRMIRIGQATQQQQQQGGFEAEADPEQDRLVGEFIEQIRKASNDPDESVQAWASFLFAALSDPEVSATIARSMVQSPSWQKRLLAIPAMGQLEPGEQTELIERLVGDEERAVQRFAKAALERLGSGAGRATDVGGPPTTAPSAPASQPAPALQMQN